MSANKDAKLDRRDFIKSAALVIGSFIGTVIGIPAIAYLYSPAWGTAQDDGWIDLGPLEGFSTGAPTLAEFTRTRTNGWERTAISYGVFVVRTDDGTVRAFSNVCTHLGCRVTWHTDIRNYVSPCHDGHFDIMGRNISGPPPRPLDEYQTRIEQGELYIRLPALRRIA